MHSPHRDVVIGDAKYQVGRFSARVGSFVLTQVMTKVLPAMLGGPATLQGLPLPSNGSSMSEPEFYAIQNHCLAVCSHLSTETGVAAPIMMVDGRLRPELEYNLPVVLALTMHALQFNLEDFFADGNPALASLKSLFPSASTSADTAPSTAT